MGPILPKKGATGRVFFFSIVAVVVFVVVWVRVGWGRVHIRPSRRPVVPRDWTVTTAATATIPVRSRTTVWVVCAIDVDLV